jgi:signal recognition particle subunit SRP54
MLGKMGGMFGMGGGGGPSPEELAKMLEELAALDPKALEQLPQELKDVVQQGGVAGGAPGRALPKGLPGMGGLGGMPRLPGLGGSGLPGLGGPGLPRFPSGPGKKKKR